MCDVCKEKAADPTVISFSHNYSENKLKLTEKRRAYIAEKEGVLRKRQIQLSEAKRKIKEVGETIITFDEKVSAASFFINHMQYASVSTICKSKNALQLLTSKS